MDYNFHTHTYRCHHANGTPEEYVIRAIENGIKYMGFSEHAPFMLPDGSEAHYRLHCNEIEDYFEEISELREKYKKKIDIKIGFEMEYYPSSFEKMLEIAKNSGAQYLILGEHQTELESRHTIVPTESVEKLKEYVTCVVSAIKSGVYSYVAHPDIFNFVGDKEIYYNEMSKICIASREYNVPLEINFLGIREKRNYPNSNFWKIAGKEKSPVTFGFDAHTAEDAFDGKSLRKAEKIVRKYNLNYIGKPKLVSIK